MVSSRSSPFSAFLCPLRGPTPPRGNFRAVIVGLGLVFRWSFKLYMGPHLFPLPPVRRSVQLPSPSTRAPRSLGTPPNLRRISLKPGAPPSPALIRFCFQKTPVRRTLSDKALVRFPFSVHPSSTCSALPRWKPHPIARLFFRP